MPYISKKQLDNIALALDVANSVIKYDTIVTYKGEKVEWRKVVNNADVAMLELYKRRKADNEKVRKIYAERRKIDKNYGRGMKTIFDV